MINSMDLVEALRNIGGHVYNRMVEDIGNHNSSPDWQYVLEQVNNALNKLSIHIPPSEELDKQLDNLINNRKE